MPFAFKIWKMPLLALVRLALALMLLKSHFLKGDKDKKSVIHIILSPIVMDK